MYEPSCRFLLEEYRNKQYINESPIYCGKTSAANSTKKTELHCVIMQFRGWELIRMDEV